MYVYAAYVVIKQSNVVLQNRLSRYALLKIDSDRSISVGGGKIPTIHHTMYIDFLRKDDQVKKDFELSSLILSLHIYIYTRPPEVESSKPLAEK